MVVNHMAFGNNCNSSRQKLYLLLLRCLLLMQLFPNHTRPMWLAILIIISIGCATLCFFYTEEVYRPPCWSSAFLEMQRSIMHTTLLCTEEPCGHPHKKLLIHLYEFMLLRSKGYYVLLRAAW